MARYFLWVLVAAAAVLLTVFSITARPPRTDREEMVRMRDQVRPQQLLGFHDLPSNDEPRRWTGVLLDAGCPTRELFSPGAQPAQRALPHAEGSGGEHPAAQQAGVERQPPDTVARQMNVGCAITGETRGFALYTPEGRMRNLDEGGNTLALEAFQDTVAGRAVLAGQSPGANPRAEVVARLHGDRLIVQEIRLL